MLSKKILTAAFAALSLTACQEEHPVPVTPSPVASAPIAVRDAGVPKSIVLPEVVVDVLVVATDTPNANHLERAHQLGTEGDANGALLEARRALFTTPGDVETLTAVAKFARKAGKPQLAAEAWSRVAALMPDDALPAIAQARAHLQFKDYEAAVKAGEEATRRDSGNVEAFQVTGIARLAQKDLSGAIASFEKAVELNPTHGWALNNLGFACLRANQNDRAVAVLSRAAEQLPQVAYVHNNLGVALERVGRQDEAKSAYQQAMDLSPKYVKARINSARVAKVQLPPDDEPAQVEEPMPEALHPIVEQ